MSTGKLEEFKGNKELIEVVDYFLGSSIHKIVGVENKKNSENGNNR